MTLEISFFCHCQFCLLGHSRIFFFAYSNSFVLQTANSNMFYNTVCWGPQIVNNTKLLWLTVTLPSYLNTIISPDCSRKRLRLAKKVWHTMVIQPSTQDLWSNPSSLWKLLYANKLWLGLETTWDPPSAKELSLEFTTTFSY